MLPSPIYHAKSEEVGCWTSEQLDSLILWLCASESARCVGGAEYCARIDLCTLFRHFLFSCFGLLA